MRNKSKNKRFIVSWLLGTKTVKDIKDRFDKKFPDRTKLTPEQREFYDKLKLLSYRGESFIYLYPLGQNLSEDVIDRKAKVTDEEWSELTSELDKL